MASVLKGAFRKGAKGLRALFRRGVNYTPFLHSTLPQHMCRCHFSLFYTHHQRSHLPRQLVLIFDMCADCHIVAATCVLPSTLLNVLVVGGTVSTFVVPMALLIITIPPLAFAHPHDIRAAAL